jgi:hypothetical protein
MFLSAIIFINLYSSFYRIVNAVYFCFYQIGFSLIRDEGTRQQWIARFVETLWDFSK